MAPIKIFLIKIKLIVMKIKVARISCILHTFSSSIQMLSKECLSLRDVYLENR